MAGGHRAGADCRVGIDAPAHVIDVIIPSATESIWCALHRGARKQDDYQNWDVSCSTMTRSSRNPRVFANSKYRSCVSRTFNYAKIVNRGVEHSRRFRRDADNDTILMTDWLERMCRSRRCRTSASSGVPLGPVGRREHEGIVIRRTAALSHGLQLPALDQSLVRRVTSPRHGGCRWQARILEFARGMDERLASHE